MLTISLKCFRHTIEKQQSLLIEDVGHIRLTHGQCAIDTVRPSQESPIGLLVVPITGNSANVCHIVPEIFVFLRSKSACRKCMVMSSVLVEPSKSTSIQFSSRFFRTSRVTNCNYDNMFVLVTN